MYEMFFYLGLVFAIAFFVLTVYLFFTQRIPEVIRFYLRRFRMKSPKRAITETYVTNENEVTIQNDTVLLNCDQTQLLNIAQNYATALLDAENTYGLSLLKDKSNVN